MSPDNSGEPSDGDDMLIRITMASKRSIRLLAMLTCLAACQFCAAQTQPESQLIVVEKDGKSGFIDHHGKVVIPFQFDKAYSFHEGLALVIVKDRKSFIDT